MPFLDQHLHRPAELLVALLDDRAVLRVGDHVVGVAAEQEQGHLGLGQRCEVVDRVLRVRQGLGLGLEVVVLLELLPVAGAALALSLAARPALEVQHGVVGQDAGDLVGMVGRPVEAIQPAAAEPFQDRLRRQPVFLGQFLVEHVPVLQGVGTAERVADVDVDEVKPFGQQGQIDLREGVEELGPPDPRFTRGRLLGHDDDRCAAVDDEVVTLVAAVLGLLAREVAAAAGVAPARNRRPRPDRRPMRRRTRRRPVSFSLHRSHRFRRSLYSLAGNRLPAGNCQRTARTAACP